MFIIMGDTHVPLQAELARSSCTCIRLFGQVAEDDLPPEIDGGLGIGRLRGAPTNGSVTKMHFPNGIAADTLPVQWIKSSYSAVGNCVELAALPDGSVAMRQSTDPTGPALVYTKAEIEAFLLGAAAGEFDSFAR